MLTMKKLHGFNIHCIKKQVIEYLQNQFTEEQIDQINAYFEAHAKELLSPSGYKKLMKLKTGM